jgi:exosortase F-associated protein
MQKNNLGISMFQLMGMFALVVLLACVRIFEKHLFYDPLNVFFKQESKILPQYNSLKLFVSIGFRYLLNALISLVILWVAFKDRQILRLSALLYVLFFVLVTMALFIALQATSPNLLLVFYLRRFLIHPLLILLFLPAFYYQKNIK